MKTVLVTGSGGFLGRNLVARLQLDENIGLRCFDINNTEQELVSSLEEADFVFHLAGVNRPEHEEEFQASNVHLTSKIVEFLQNAEKKTPVVLSSSIQATLDNPYGRSKKQAEDIVFAYGGRNDIPVHVYRLPGLFGKWSRPNYNSVVATFCYNISHDLPVQINDPNHELAVAYIDDVVAEFLATMDGKAHWDQKGFCFVPQTFSIKLQALADLIISFRASRDTAVLPDMGDPLIKCLYSTYLSYLETDDFSYLANTKTDNRGWLFELVKSPHMGQIFVSQTKPGVTRGGHYHHTKVEKFVVVQGQATIRFRKIDADDIIEYSVSDNRIEVVDIPPGYTHDITNTGNADVITLFWANEIFDPEKPDTYYMRV